MKQGDFFRIPALLSIASAGAGLALIGASVSGHLGSTTTIEEFVPSPTTSTLQAADAAGGGMSVQQIYKLDAPGVVAISASASPAGHGAAAAEVTLRPLGSGFVIDKAGHILTTSDVVAGARTVEVSFSGNDELSARVVGVDRSTGIAVLQVDVHSRALIPLRLGDSDDVEVGDPVVAIGNPVSRTRTATTGIVSGLQRTVDSAQIAEQAIETDAAIDDMSSGGPLINGSGQVIGVDRALSASASARDGAGTIGLGLAIPIDTVKSVVAELIRDGRAEHAYLGISGVAVTAPVARAYDLPSVRGLLVQAVFPGSAAGSAGLRAGSTVVVMAGEAYRLGGDIIVAADGHSIANQAQLQTVLQELVPGDRLELKLWRGGREQSVVVTLGQPPS